MHSSGNIKFENIPFYLPYWLPVSDIIPSPDRPYTKFKTGNVVVQFPSVVWVPVKNRLTP